MARYVAVFDIPDDHDTDTDTIDLAIFLDYNLTRVYGSVPNGDGCTVWTAEGFAADLADVSEVNPS